MKGRAFAAVVLSLLLLLSGLGIGGWWLLWQRGPLRLAHQRLAMPRAARFVPASAAFSFYLFSDAEQPVAYARAVAPTRQRRRAAEAIARLRDGAFAAAGLDYPGELAGWVGSDIAVALLEDPVAAATGEAAEQPTRGWLLALASRDDDGARRFLQRFWQTRSLAGTDLQVSRYRGMGMISGRGALLGSQPVPLATALVDDDLVLIASGRNLLERALDVSQIPELNQAGLPQVQQGLAAFESGAALVVASPEALQGWLGLPPSEADPEAESPPLPASLLAVLQPQGRALELRTRLTVPRSLALEPLEAERGEALLAAVPGAPTSLALLQNPAALEADPLLHPLLERSLGRRPAERAERQGPLPDLLARTVSGPLLAAQGPEGWWIGSAAGEPAAEVLDPRVQDLGLVQAPLDLEGRHLQVWTHLEWPQRSGGRGGRRGRKGASAGTRAAAGAGEPLRATLMGWRERRDDLAWWGQSLAQLEIADDSRALERLRRGLQNLQSPQAPLQWSLEGEDALALLRSWQPWRLLSALAGGGLDGPVRGLALAVSTAAVEPDAAPQRIAGTPRWRLPGKAQAAEAAPIPPSQPSWMAAMAEALKAGSRPEGAWDGESGRPGSLPVQADAAEPGKDALEAAPMRPAGELRPSASAVDPALLPEAAVPAEAGEASRATQAPEGSADGAPGAPTSQGALLPEAAPLPEAAASLGGGLDRPGPAADQSGPPDPDQREAATSPGPIRSAAADPSTKGFVDGSRSRLTGSGDSDRSLDRADPSVDLTFNGPWATSPPDAVLPEEADLAAAAARIDAAAVPDLPDATPGAASEAAASVEAALSPEAAVPPDESAPPAAAVAPRATVLPEAAGSPPNDALSDGDPFAEAVAGGDDGDAGTDGVYAAAEEGGTGGDRADGDGPDGGDGREGTDAEDRTAAKQALVPDQATPDQAPADRDSSVRDTPDQAPAERALAERAVAGGTTALPSATKPKAPEEPEPQAAAAPEPQTTPAPQAAAEPLAAADFAPQAITPPVASGSLEPVPSPAASSAASAPQASTGPAATPNSVIELRARLDLGS